MKQIFVLSANSPPQDDMAESLICTLKMGACQGWTLATTPKEADIILFMERNPPNDPLLFRVLRHPFYRQFRDRVVAHHEGDNVFPLIPGFYPALEKSLQVDGYAMSANYIAHETRYSGPDINYLPADGSEEFLYSFRGSSTTHRVRTKILKLNDSRAYLQDVGTLKSWSLPVAKQREIGGEFAKLLGDSKFVLCPRGLGSTSFRLYETMQAGRVPVIISDEWVPPEGMGWAEFSIQVPEKDVEKLPEVLREAEPRSIEMGRQARKAWENFCQGERAHEWLLNRLAQWKTPTTRMRRIARCRVLIKVTTSRLGWRLLRRSLNASPFIPTALG